MVTSSFEAKPVCVCVCGEGEGGGEGRDLSIQTRKRPKNMEKQKIQWALFHREIKTAEQRRKKRQWSACKYSRTSSLLAARDVSWERNFSSDKERGETAVFEWGTETFSQNLSQNSRVESLILQQRMRLSNCSCPSVKVQQHSGPRAVFLSLSVVSNYFLFLYKC